MVKQVPKRLFISALLIVLTVACDQGSSRGSRGSYGSSGSGVSEYDVSLLANACACKGNQALSIGCTEVCQSKDASSSQDTLYLETFLSSNIELNPEIGTLYNWCYKELSEDSLNPGCILEAKNKNQEIIELEVNISSSKKSFSVNVDPLSYYETYIISLVETSTGKSSNSIQFSKVPEVNNPLGTLTMTAVNRYNCFVNYIVDDQYIDNFYRLTYIYAATPPLAIPPGTDGIYCHDKSKGAYDNPFLPRLELEPNAFSIWSTTDPRFYDNDGNARYDIHDIIAERIGATDINVFQPIKWPKEPEVARPEEEQGSNLPNLGFIFTPIVDQRTNQSFCLKNSHYSSGNALYREVGTLTGVEMEGLYIAKRVPTAYTGPTGTPVSAQSNFILLKESVLKKIWYYLDHNQNKKIPTENNVRNKIVYFRWPHTLNDPNYDPFEEQASQEVYQVIYQSNDAGGIPQAPTHDKKIGCIPKSI